MIVVALLIAAALYTAWFVVRDATAGPASAPHPAPPVGPEPVIATPREEPEPLEPEPEPGDLTAALPMLEPASLNGDGGEATDTEVRIPFELARLDLPSREVVVADPRAVAVLEELLAPLPQAERSVTVDTIPRRAVGVPRFRPDPDRLIQSVVYVRNGRGPFAWALSKLVAAVVFFGLLLGVTLVGATRGLISLFAG